MTPTKMRDKMWGSALKRSTPRLYAGARIRGLITRQNLVNDKDGALSYKFSSFLSEFYKLVNDSSRNGQVVTNLFVTTWRVLIVSGHRSRPERFLCESGGGSLRLRGESKVEVTQSP